MNTKITLTQLINFDSSDKERVEKILPMIDYVINSDEFKKRILETEFSDTSFRDADGNEREIESNEEIYRILKAGKERNSPEPEDGEWDLRIGLYRSITREVGHAENGIIYTKKRKFRNWTLKFLASHWMHEYTHVLGFRHDFRNTDRRGFSVPYVVDDIAEDILEESDQFDE